MAKQSMIQRELKRNKLVKKYAKKRKQALTNLKTAKNLTEIFSMQRTLQRLPGNSSPIRLKNRCWKTGVVEVSIVILGFHVMFYVKWLMSVYFPEL